VRQVCYQFSNFLDERLAVEQATTLKAMSGKLTASSGEDLIEKAKPLVEILFPESMSEFSDAVCDSWEDITEVPHLPPGTDAGCVLSIRLQQMLPRTVGLLQILLAAIKALSPHSMQTERCVSNYNNIRSVCRLSMLPETVNHHLQIAPNAPGTAQFDPRPAVAEFLKYKNR